MIHRALFDPDGRELSGARSSGGLYQLGYRLLALGAGAPSEFDIVALARPALQQLHALTAESVFLSIIVGRNRVTIDDIQAQGPPRIAQCARPSRSAPLHQDVARAAGAFERCEVGGYLTRGNPLSRAQSGRDPPSETIDGVWGRYLRHSSEGLMCCGATPPPLQRRLCDLPDPRRVRTRACHHHHRRTARAFRPAANRGTAFPGCAAFSILWNAKRGFSRRRLSWSKHEQLGKTRFAHPGIRGRTPTNPRGHGNCALSFLGAGDRVPAASML